ncbi:MAG: L,D-transpeptidase family protein [Deltaproteobacteria bacterium]|nr:L,D-transpeptidase family protein [Deltaproteobacteria bacterium]
MFKVLMTIIIFFLLWASPVCASQVSSVIALFDKETSERIEVILDSRGSSAAPSVGVTRLLSHEQIFNLYQQRLFLPIWFDGWQLKPEARGLLENLRNAGMHGLCSNDYLLTELEILFRIQRDLAQRNLPLSSTNRAILDLFLSQAFLTFATHMVEGQVDPALAHVDWRARRRKADLVKLLEYAIGNHRISPVLEGLIPPHEEYRQLINTLSQYQELSALGGWPQMPPGPTIRPGDSDERVPLLRSLLLKTGDLEQVVTIFPVFDQETQDAVRVFQVRHGLVDDGVVGPRTFEALNVSVEERIRQIELNLERWRWMPKSFGKRHIRVNVADFSLEVMEDGEPVMQMPVIVGTQYRKTPVFSSRMTYLEFAPYWTVPPTILREDKLPKIKRNPDYLEEKHFKIISRKDRSVTIDPLEIKWATVRAPSFPGLLRMEPGPWNPLGRVKFMFPNRFNVYLHDTNQAYLFNNNIRSFSSGCIRVERPRDLADYLVGEDIGKKRLNDLLGGTVPRQVSIKPLPVHIQYWTAWVDREGLVHFRPDVYFRDLDLDIALNEPAYRVMEQLQVNTGKRLARNDELKRGL